MKDAHGRNIPKSVHVSVLGFRDFQWRSEEAEAQQFSAKREAERLEPCDLAITSGSEVRIEPHIGK